MNKTFRYTFEFSKSFKLDYGKVNEICRWQIEESFINKSIKKSNYAFYIVDNITDEVIAFWIFKLDIENKVIDSALICAADIGLKGLGSSLINYGINVILENTPIENVYIYPANKPLIKFYESLGFELISQEENLDGSYNMIMNNPKIKPLKQYPFMTISYEEGKVLYDTEKLEDFLEYKINKELAKEFIKLMKGFENTRKELEKAVPFKDTGSIPVNIKPIELKELYKKVLNESVNVTPINLKIKIKTFYSTVTALERIEHIKQLLKK
jgi:hypothetical protein